MVTPVTSSTPTTQQLTQAIAQDQRTFYQILVAELQNQDPLSPLSLSSLSQQILAGTQIQAQLTGDQTLLSISNSTLLTLLSSLAQSTGKNVQYKNNALSLTNGQGTVTYNLDANATKLVIDIFDSNGKQVSSAAIKALGNSAPKIKGNNTFNVNTLNSTMTGNYTYSVTAYNSSNQLIIATPYASSQIQSSSILNGGVSITLNNGQSVDANNLLQIG